MIIRPKRYRDSEPSLIEDVVMPHAAPFTDVSREVVRRRSIGNLQQQYDRSRQATAAPFQYVPSGGRSSFSRKAPPAGYTVVPPLRSLPDIYSGTTTFLPPLTLPARLTGKPTSGPGRVRKLAASLIAFLFGWLPKRYTASSGLTPDWDTAAYRTKVAVPFVLILGVLALLIFGVVTAPGRQGAGTTAINPRTLPITVSNSSSRNHPGSSTGSSTAPPAPSTSSSAAATPAATSAATAPSALTGGMGAGPAGSGSSSSSTLPLNLTTTIPPTNVQAGGKTLLNTSGTTLTVN